MTPFTTSERGALALWPVRIGKFPAWKAGQPQAVRAWLDQTGFKPLLGKFARLPPVGRKGAGVVVIVPDRIGTYALAELPRALAAGTFAIARPLRRAEATAAALGWGLGAYRFNRYKRNGNGNASAATLVWPPSADRTLVTSMVAAHALVRDLINTPTEDMGPDALAAAARSVAKSHQATFSVIIGDELLRRNFPAIHAVGRAATREPRLIDLRWGKADAPKVTLVGKGVCFDSGGLDIKPAAGMRWMKKDMGGAATALGLAQLIMAARLPVRLRLLIPAVENAIAGNAYRPGDVIKTRKGITVEIGNTDAEGRVILCDALALADEEAPELLIDFATLTGAARIAVGTELTALFTTDDVLAEELVRHGESQNDYLWRLPLWAPYRRLIDSKIADMSNSGDSPFGGAITAALFLKEFVTGTRSWAHLDLFAWNDSDRPGRPFGGEAMTMRALFAMLSDRYGA
ncbi:MAG: leucyl aminopeptidase family protein [Alphaproteobacteria bacterium]|nr:leucyl aminopeptidase family protein [Alphaproteobacteria bacterium]